VELEALQAHPVVPSPDWTIRDLFLHFGKRSTIEHREALGLEVRDKLSTSQLKIWGRKKLSIGLSRNPLTEIPHQYWSEADFTYTFLMEGEQYQYDVHARSQMLSHGVPYSDLQVNRAQAKSIWPTSLRG
jgi:hypothetical protein